MSIKQIEAPTCRLCEKKHWAREGCFAEEHKAPVKTEDEKRYSRPRPTPEPAPKRKAGKKAKKK